jgi:hypothetical protein
MVDLRTGQILKQYAAASNDDAYSYGPVVVDGRYILQGGEIMGTDPATAFFSDDGEPNKWPNARCVSAAHVCGLHFIRGQHKLYCYDLRALPSEASAGLGLGLSGQSHCSRRPTP